MSYEIDPIIKYIDLILRTLATAVATPSYYCGDPSPPSSRERAPLEWPRIIVAKADDGQPWQASLRRRSPLDPPAHYEGCNTWTWSKSLYKKTV